MFRSYLLPVSLLPTLITGMLAASPLLPASAQVLASTTQSPSLECNLDLSVYIVADLVPKPVPFTDFSVTDSSGNEITCRTDVNGKVTVPLAVGHYVLASAAPVQYDGQTYTWSKGFDIVTGASELALTITQADATVTGSGPTPGPATNPVTLAPGAIYKMDGPGVVCVQSDFGQGSGFLVDKKLGLFLTNAHVVNNTHQVEVRFDRGIRYPAVVVLADKEADIAVVGVNPSIIPANVESLPLRDLAGEPLSEGDSAFAIGWPLHQDRIITEGIISRVENNVIITDVNINHGNSGGPLLDDLGRVVGVTTFLDSAENGPGISGVIAITKAADILKRAQNSVQQGNVPDIANYQLPDVPVAPIDPAALEQSQQQDLKPWIINAPRDFVTELSTPYVRASEENAVERLEQNGKSKRIAKRAGSDSITDESENPVEQYWRTFVGDGEAVVSIQIYPQLKEKQGSLSRSIFGAMLGGLAGSGPIATQHTYEFRDDFYDMQLWRGSHLILPVTCNRTTTDLLYLSQYIKVNDQAYVGVYGYDPSAFAPGDELTIKMRRESDLATWDTIKVDDQTRSKIWEQFSSYISDNPTAAVPHLAPPDAELAALQQKEYPAVPTVQPSAPTTASTPSSVPTTPPPALRTSFPTLRH